MTTRKGVHSTHFLASCSHARMSAFCLLISALRSFFAEARYADSNAATPSMVLAGMRISRWAVKTAILIRSISTFVAGSSDFPNLSFIPCKKSKLSLSAFVFAASSRADCAAVEPSGMGGAACPNRTEATNRTSTRFMLHIRYHDYRTVNLTGPQGLRP